MSVEEMGTIRYCHFFVARMRRRDERSDGQRGN